jgi:16S rRNA (uracil1498-N3)-methyltransferase
VTPPLFLLDELPAGDDLLLAGDEGRHAARVKRLRPNEAVWVSDGRGGLLECRVSAVTGDAVMLRVLVRREVPPQDPRLVVVQALPKGERAEQAVETMTELGVDVIVPWHAERSIVQWRGARGEKALERWRRTAREAAKQSRRARLPEVTPVATTADVAGTLRTAACALVLHEAAADPLAGVRLPDRGDVTVVVGPEGGIADGELAAFAAAGARAVRLGPAVLRTSSAGPAALAVLSVHLSRWK